MTLVSWYSSVGLVNLTMGELVDNVKEVTSSMEVVS
jgi:hypothetical protein